MSTLKCVSGQYGTLTKELRIGVDNDYTALYGRYFSFNNPIHSGSSLKVSIDAGGGLNYVQSCQATLYISADPLNLIHIELFSTSTLTIEFNQC